MTRFPFSVVSRRDVVADDPLAKKEKLRAARLDAARRQSNWVEIPAERLVARGPDRFQWRVDAATDRIWRVTRGDVFEPGTAMIVATHTSVTFTVEGGHVVALEPVEPVGTWSEVVSRRPDLVQSS